MKKINTNIKSVLSLTLFLFVLSSFAQSPPKINYQGVARSANGNPIANKSMGIKFFVAGPGVSSGTVSYATNVTSNAVGIFNTQVDLTNAVIDWSNGPFTLRVLLDTTGGTTYSDMGIQTLGSVPYAMHAASIPQPSFNGGILSIGDKSVTIPSSGTTQTLSVNNNVISISGGNSVNLPALTGVGNTTVSAGSNGYTVSSQGTTLTGGTTVLGTPVPPGLLQVMGSYPNYSLIVTPNISYSQSTGSLTLSNYLGTSPPYAYDFYITPAITFQNGFIRSGPATNQADINPYTPWRTGPVGIPSATLAAPAGSVGIGVGSAAIAARLHVNGYTKLGDLAPAIQMEKITGSAPPASGNLQYAIPAYISLSKIISITVMIDASNSFDWVPPGYTGSPNLQFNWKVSGQFVVIENAVGNSSLLAGKPLRILITYE